MTGNDPIGPHSSTDQQLQLLAEAVVDCAFLTVDTSNRVTNWSKGAEHLFGYTHAEALNREIAQLYTEEDRAHGEMERECEAALRDGRHEAERWLVCKNGQRLWGHAIRIAVRNQAGELQGYACVIRDLSSKHQEQQEADRRRQQHAFLLEFDGSLRTAEAPQAAMSSGLQKIAKSLGAVRVSYTDRVSIEQCKLQDNWFVHSTADSKECGPPSITDRMLEMFQANQVWTVHDVERDGRSSVKRMLPEYISRGVQASLSIPVCKNGVWHALLVVESAERREWLQADIELLQQLGERLSAELERTRLAETLRQNEDRFRRMFQVEAVGIIFFRLSGEILQANHAFLSMSGFTEQEIAAGQLTLHRMITADWKPALRHASDELNSSGSTKPHEMEYRRSDGTRRWGLFAPKKLTDEEGVEFILDITERKEVEQELRDSQRQFETLANFVPELLWATDPSGMKSWCNQQWIDYTGQALDDTHALGWLDVIYPEDREASKEGFIHSIQTGTPWRHEHRIRRKDGEYRWFMVQATPIRDEMNQIVQWFGAVTDVHDQRLAIEMRSKDLERAHRELQALTAQLMSAQEEAARWVARELHDSVSQQLAAIGMDLARVRQELSPNHLTFVPKLAEIERETSVLTEEVRQLSHRLHPSILEDLGIASALHVLAEEFERKHGFATALDLRRLVHIPPPALSTALYRVTQEALRNVAKHAPGDVRVTIRIVEEAECIRLTIEDDGPGFDRSTTHPGLGLISMQERARLIGGRLHVHSAPGEGTIVELVAPLPSHITIGAAIL